MQPIRLGVIGTGLIWIRTHKAILATLRDAFMPIAFCDLSAERRAAARQEFPDAAVFDDYHSLLAMPEVEAVLVLTPIALNAPVARAALLAGKHVIMEKPIARSVTEGANLVALARRAGKQLIVTEQFAYRHADDALAGIIAAGEIGELVLWEQVQHLEPDPTPDPLRYASTPWRKQADYPLGTMFDAGIHLIARLSKVFGVPHMVAATGRRLRPEYGEYDHIAALFRYGGAVTGMLSHSSYLPAAQNHFHVHGTAGILVVESGRIVVQRHDRPPRVVDLPAENAYVAMWRAFVRAFSEERDPFYTPERALHDVAILEAIDQAIKTGRSMPIVADV